MFIATEAPTSLAPNQRQMRVAEYACGILHICRD